MAIDIFGQDDDEEYPVFDPMDPYKSKLAPKPPVEPTQPPMQQGQRPYQGPPTQPWWQQQKPPTQVPPMAAGGPMPQVPPPTQAGPPGVVPDDEEVSQEVADAYKKLGKPVPKKNERYPGWDSLARPIQMPRSPPPLWSQLQAQPQSNIPPHNPMSNRPTGMANQAFAERPAMGPPPKEGGNAEVVGNINKGPYSITGTDAQIKQAFKDAEMAKRGIAPPGPINPVQQQRPAMGPPPGYVNKEQREQAEKDKIIDYMKKHEASGKTGWDAEYEEYLRRGWGKGGIHPLARGLTFEEPYDKNAVYAKNWDPTRDRDMNGKSFTPRAEGMVSSSVPATSWSDGKLTIGNDYNSPHITMKEVGEAERKRQEEWKAWEGRGKSPLNKDISRGDRDIDRPLPQGSKGFMLASDMKEAQSKGITPPPFERRPGQIIENPTKAPPTGQYVERKPGEVPYSWEEIQKLNIPATKKLQLKGMANWKYIPTKEEIQAFQESEAQRELEYPGNDLFTQPPWIKMASERGFR
jgi:hypothetical protein